jgi:hypothetical protein
VTSRKKHVVGCFVAKEAIGEEEATGDVVN